eukprot:6205579-Pleurochrysis_carterae.AAC.1
MMTSMFDEALKFVSPPRATRRLDTPSAACLVARSCRLRLEREPLSERVRNEAPRSRGASARCHFPRRKGGRA